jgi:hypothetical protein
LKKKIVGYARSNGEDEIETEIKRWVINESPDVSNGVDLEVEITIKTKKISGGKKTKTVKEESPKVEKAPEKKEKRHIGPKKRSRVKINL